MYSIEASFAEKHQKVTSNSYLKWSFLFHDFLYLSILFPFLQFRQLEDFLKLQILEPI